MLQNDETQKSVDDVEVICLDPCWVLDGTTLYRVEGSPMARRFILNGSNETIRVPADEMEPFLQDFYPSLQDAQVPVYMDEELTEQKVVEPSPRLYLREKGRRLDVELRAAYEDYEVSPDDQDDSFLLPVQPDEKENGMLVWTVKRDLEKENQWIDELYETGLESNG